MFEADIAALRGPAGPWLLPFPEDGLRKPPIRGGNETAPGGYMLPGKHDANACPISASRTSFLTDILPQTHINIS